VEWNSSFTSETKIRRPFYLPYTIQAASKTVSTHSTLCIVEWGYVLYTKSWDYVLNTTM